MSIAFHRSFSATTATATAAVVLLLTAGCGDTTAPQFDFAKTPANAQFVTADADRFWRAYQTGGAAVYQTQYLDSGSAAFKEFAQSRGVTASLLQQMSTAYRQYFEAMRPWWTGGRGGDAAFATIRGNYARLAALLPEATFPPVYFVVGRYSTGGTVNARGIIIGTEFYGVDAAAPQGELNAFSRNNQMSWRTDLPRVVAHEHTHLLQMSAGTTSSNNGATLLARALNEGGAEFVGSLAAGAPLFVKYFSVWQQREREFYTAFMAERNGTDVSRWLYNQGGIADNANAPWPGDLGYFMGFRIAQAYYNRATDKTKALRDIIAAKDPEAILTASGYAGTGPTITVP